MLIQYAEVKPIVAVTTKTANFINSFSEKKKNPGRGYCYFHTTDEETEIQRN